MYSQLTPPPSSTATSKSLDHSPNFSRYPQSRRLNDELRVPPRIPPVIKNLSYSVKRAKSQLKKSCLNSDLGNDSQEHESQETFENGLRFVSIQIVTQAIIAQQAKREWQRVLALATAWELESDVQHATLSQLVLQQDAIQYARTDAELRFLQNILARRNDNDSGTDMETKKKRYQREVMAFCTADSQLDHAEDLARNLCQSEKDAPADDNTMEGKVLKCELKDGLAPDSKPEFDN
ncbi:hypothetical protein EV424DRAFT_1541310 [Suillus variegatus]|nr:hypothetical protein EV424DRAFT_1541310 [Suillus variegatus]